jgi:two-component system phosphate regulon sensor histidine kinase PhoR
LTAHLSQILNTPVFAEVAPIDARLQIDAVSRIDFLSRIFRDISHDLMRCEAELKKGEAARIAILDTLPVGVLLLTHAGKIYAANSEVSEIFPAIRGVGREATVQGHIRIAEVTRIFETIRSDGSVEPRDVALLGDGDRVVRISGALLRENIAEWQVMLVVEEVTDRRRSERIRREFIGNVSHELRTPITALIGTSEMLLEGIDDKAQERHFIDVIHRHAERLHLLVKDLLTLSRLDHPAAIRSLNREAVVISDLCLDAIETVREGVLGADSRINVGFSIGKTVPESVMIHRSLIRNALVNLLENAAKHVGDDGVITLSVTREGDQLLLRVIDNGVGIGPEHLPRIFERFYRVDKGRSRQEGGSGIGLAIVKHVALVHEGRVSAESVVGKGSTFTITIPIYEESDSTS